MEKIVEEIIKDLPERTNSWVEMQCPNAPNHYKILLDRKISALPKESKQKILDLFHDGKNIGDVGKELGVDTDVIAGVLLQNFDTIHILRTEAR